MTCESALELLLDAEPSEFSASERTPLGEHLRGCGRCRRLAAQMMQDTQQLAVAMESAVPVRRPARRALQVALTPAFVVATLLFAVVFRTRSAGTPTVLEPTRSERPAPPSVALPAGPPNVDVKATDSQVRPAAARRAFARAVPLAPVRLQTSRVPRAPLSVESNGVTVIAPAGTRATVMHTSNPKLVVVWFY